MASPAENVPAAGAEETGAKSAPAEERTPKESPASKEGGKEKTSNPAQSKAQKGEKPEKPDKGKSEAKAKEEKKDKDPAASEAQRKKKEEDPATAKSSGVSMGIVACYLKVGDHSITGDGAVNQPREVLGPAVRANAISLVANRLYRDETTFLRDVARSIRISSTVMGSNAYGGNRSVDIHTDVPLLRVANDATLAIRGRATRRIDSLNMAQAQQFLLDSRNLSTTPIASALTGAINMPIDAARAMAPLLLSNLERVDMLAMYTKGWCLALLMAVVEGRRAAAAVQPTNWSPFDGNWDNILWGAADFRDTFGAALTSRRLLLLRDEFTGPQIACLCHIGREGTPLALPGEGELQPRIAAIVWQGIPFTMLSTVAVVPEAAADFTSAMMVGTLTQLAATRGENADLTRGLYRASVLFAQTVRPGAGERQPEWFLSTAERAISTTMPSPVDSNAMWRWLGLAHARADADSYAAEVKTACSLSGYILTRTAASLGMLFGAGEALAFHTMNIGGTVLNATAGQPDDGGQAMLAALNEVLRVPGGGDPPVAFVHELACAELVQITQIVFQVDAFVGVHWNDGNEAMAVPDALTAWEGRFGHRVPYCMSPLSLTKYLKYWPANWGIFKGDVAMNVKSEVIPRGGSAGWYADRGDVGYRAITKEGDTTNPAYFIPYAPFMMNAFTQFGHPAALDFAYREWPRGYGGPEMPAGERPAPALIAADFHLGLGVLRPGFVLSYDWSTDTVLAPFVTQAQFGALWPTVLYDRFGRLDNVGLLIQDLEAPPNAALGSMSIRNGFRRGGGAANRQPPPDEGDPEAPEN